MVTPSQKLALKVVISIGLLAWLYTLIDVQIVLSHIYTLSPVYLLAVLALSVLGLFISATKWRLLLGPVKDSPSFGSVLRLFWIGAFFNNFLPGRTGGDIIRAYGITSATQTASGAITSVIVDRGLNLIALIAIAWGALLITPQALPTQIYALLLAGSSLALTSALIGFIILYKWQPQTQTTWLKKIITAVQGIANTPKALLLSSLLSLIYQTTVILGNYCVAKSLHIDLAVWVFFYAIPVTALITLIPISLNGFGLREGAYALIFVPLGISTASAISISLIATGCMLAISLIGGLFYAFGSVRIASDNNTLTHKPSNV